MSRDPSFFLKGYKVGATNDASQKNMSLSAPFRAPLPSSAIVTSPASGFSPNKYIIRGVECEFTFKIHTDLKPKSSGKPFTVEDVKSVIEGLYPSLEICGTRIDGDNIPVPLKIADGGSNTALVLGPKFNMWEKVDLARSSVTLKVNNRSKAKGIGSDVLGGPLLSLTWLANSLRESGLFLEADQYICTGTMTGMTKVEAGDEVEANFGSLGSVHLKLGH